ncbi:MAG: methyltransferase domain-containing protein [Halothiobacillus sp.]
MDRIKTITKFISKEMRGIEVAPWHSPLAPKRDGYNCISLDIFNTDDLRNRSQNDELVPEEKLSNIEEVDIVGNATDIAELVDKRGELGTYDYIISSHNFEHLPNPIKFLQGCGRVLKKNGLISMAIPDKRGCFDYFRPHSTTADFIEAFFEDRKMPSLAQQFAHTSLTARYNNSIVFMQNENPSNVRAGRSLAEDFHNWQNRLNQEIPEHLYADIHCSVFTPAVFYLIISDLRFMRLSNFEVIGIEPTGGAEFFVHMRNMDSDTKIDEARFFENRQMLLHAINDEVGSNSSYSYKVMHSYMTVARDLEICKQSANNNPAKK